MSPSTPKANLAASEQPFVLAPPPSWLAALVPGSPPVLAWCVGRSLVLRAGTAWFEVLEGELRRVEPSSPPVRRVPVALSADQAARVRTFAQRLRWLHGESGTRYTPTAREARLHASLSELRRVRSPADATVRCTPGDDATERALALWVHLIGGRWAPVFEAIDAGELHACSPWIEPVSLGVAGDVARLRQVAARPPRSADALALIEAVGFELAGLGEAARERYVAGAQAIAGSAQANVFLRIAKLLRLAGRAPEAVPYARRALLAHDDERTTLRGADELVRCGAWDDAYDVLRVHVGERTRGERATPHADEPGDGSEAALLLAELLLWAGRHEEAAPLLQHGPETARRCRARGIVHVLAGRVAEAEPLFARAAELAPGDMETLLWLAEVQVRLGDLERASATATAARVRVQTPLHALLQGAFTSPGKELFRVLEVLGEPVSRWAAAPRETTLRLLERFGGNRGELLTMRAPGVGTLELLSFQPPRADSILSSRTAAGDVLRAVGEASLDELQRRFDAIEREYPHSPHPLCYRGELDLWLGDYERAIARFDAALRRAPARWGYVGRAAAQVLLGRFAAAEASLVELGKTFLPVQGSTTPVYVGEMWLRRGEPRRAVAELSEAVAAKPGRVGAWMNLALARLELGERDEALSIVSELVSCVPRVFWDAGRALGERGFPPEPARAEAYLTKALELMRGNRSSHTITYFDHEDVFRVTRPAGAWRETLANHTSLLTLALRNRMASGVEE